MKTKSSILVLVILLIIQGCSLEHKYAVEFARNTSKRNILVFTATTVDKSNLKTYLLDSLENVTDNNKDSLLLVNSDFLNDINDSLFLANYNLGYLKTLKSLGLNVFTSDNVTDFLERDTNNYRINIAQVQLEETLYDYRDEMEIYGDNYYHDFALNSVYLNSWFEVSKYDKHDESKRYVYFATDFATDIPDGKFDYDIFSRKVRYMYNIDSLKVENIYEFAYYTGGEFAMFTFDLLLNSELNNKVPESERTNYWSFDPENGVFYPAGEDRLVPMDK